MAENNSNRKKTKCITLVYPYLENLEVMVAREIDHIATVLTERPSKNKKKNKDADENKRYQQDLDKARTESQLLAAKEQEYDELLQQTILKSKHEDQKEKGKEKRKEEEKKKLDLEMKNRQQLDVTCSNSKALDEHDEQLKNIIRLSKIEEEQRLEREKHLKEERKKKEEMENRQQLDLACSHSKALEEHDEELKNVLHLSQIEEQQRQERERRLKEERKKKEEIKNQLVRNNIKENIINIIQKDPYDDNVYNRISKKLDTYEVLGTSIFDAPRTRPPLATLNERSMLIIEVIKIFEYNYELGLEDIIKYFKRHIIDIVNECSNIKTVCKYHPDMHKTDEMSEFKHQAISDKFVCVDIRGDGNCLWNSVSVSLFGDMSYMVSLRLLTAYTLVKYRKNFEDYIQEQRTKYGYQHELTFNQLVRASVDLNVWGDEMHVFALSLALRRPIYSYGSLIALIDGIITTYDDLKCEYEKEAIYNHFNYLANTNDVDKEPILLYYNGETHYSVVLPMQDDVVPLIPKSEILEPLFGNTKNDTAKKDVPKKYETSPSDEKAVLNSTTVFPETESRKLENYQHLLHRCNSEIRQLSAKLEVVQAVNKKKIVECSKLHEQINDLQPKYEKLLWERNYYKEKYFDLLTNSLSNYDEAAAGNSTNEDKRYLIFNSSRPQEQPKPTEHMDVDSC